MREVVPCVRESLVTSEDIKVGENFISGVKALVVAIEKIRETGIDLRYSSEIRFATEARGSDPSVLLIPSKPVKIWRMHHSESQRDPGDLEIEEPIFLESLWVN